MPKIKLTATSTKKIKNIVFAISAAPAAILENPNIPAIIATMKNINVHFNIKIIFDSVLLCKVFAKIVKRKNGSQQS